MRRARRWRLWVRECWRRVDWPGIGLFVASLAVYVHTLAPGVLPSDYGEYQFKIYTLRLIHPPGYPLYVVLGRIWLSLVPFGSIAYRLNLFSAVCAAVAVWLLYRFLRSFLEATLPALVGGGLLAFSPLFWSQALTANAYVLNTLLFAASLYVWLLAYGRRCSVAWVALIFGLGLAHHRLLLVSAPVLLIAAVALRRRMLPSIRTWGLSALALLLPLGLYGVLALQGAWPWPVLLRFILISGGPIHFITAPVAVFERLTQTVWPWLYQELGLFLTLVGLGGPIAFLMLSRQAQSATDWPRRCRLTWLLIGLLLFYVAFYCLVRIDPDEPRYFVPAYALVAMGVGAAVAGVRAVVRSLWKSPTEVGRPVSARVILSEAFVALALILPALMLSRHLPEITRQYRDDYFDRLTQEALRTVEEGSIIVATWPYAMPLYYYQTVEGWRPDVQILMPPDQVNREQTVAWIEEGRPVYFREGTFGLDWPESGYPWVCLTLGGLCRALPQAPVFTHWFPIQDAPPLQAAGLSVWPLQPDTLVALRTLWEADGIRVGESGARLWFRLMDAHQQTWGQWTMALVPSRSIQTVGEAIQVDLFFVTPPAIPPGMYSLDLHLSQDGQDLAAIVFPEVPIVARERPLALERLIANDWTTAPVTSHGLRLIAADWPGRHFNENTAITLPLFWQVVDDQPSFVSPYLCSGQQCWPLLEQTPVLENTTAADLPIGTLLESKHGLVFNRAPPGRYRVEVRVDTGDQEDIYDLGQIEIKARRRVYWAPLVYHRVHTVLGGEIELLGYNLKPEMAHPGENLTLSLYWRPLARPTGNYKVFTHLMGPQDTLVAQRDDLPLGGIVLTSQWSPREVLSDQYVIAIPADLAAGTYRVEVGMYHPDSGERLPAVDKGGNRWLNDKVVLQEIEIEPR